LADKISDEFELQPTGAVGQPRLLKAASNPRKNQNLSQLTALKDMTVSHNPHADVSGIDEGRLLRKVDWKLLPWLSFLYFLSFLDRTSIGNAKVQ
jgi:hypothetical protein